MPKPKKALDAGQAPGRKARAITDQQELFCQEYLKDLNGTQAAIRAKYSAASASQLAHELLEKPLVAARIVELKKKRGKRLEISQDRILNEIAEIAFARMSDVVEIKSGRVTISDSEFWSKRSKVAVSEVHETTNETGGSLRIKMHDKLSALEKLAKHVGLFDKGNGSDSGDEVSLLDSVTISLKRAKA